MFELNRKPSAVGEPDRASTPETPVSVSWNAIEVQAQRLSALVNDLYSRLYPLLTPNAPPDGASGTKSSPAVSPMAESFSVVAANLQSSNAAIERLLQRIEL